jgi:type IV secretion system protein TrbI
MTTKIESPDGLELRGTPKISARLNKKAVMIAVAVMVGVFVYILSNLSKPPKDMTKNTKPEQPQTFTPAMGTASALTNDVPDQPLLLPAEPPRLPRESAPPPNAASTQNVPTLVDPGFVGALPPASGSTSAPSTTPAEQVMKAFESNTELVTFAERQAKVEEAMAPRDAISNQGATRQSQAVREDPAVNKDDPNHQSQKEAFLERGGRSQRAPFLIVQLNPPINEFEIKTGTVIPGVMITHINSDLPGEIVGQVSQNIFDSATGQHLLIPQGSKLFGQYQSSVTFGQSRLLVVWNRIIFPNTTTMDLSGMAGHDKAGTAGLADRVNNHYLQTFGFALLTSIFSAAFQLSQPQETISNDAVLSNRQVVGAAVGQQMSQLGIEIAKRNLNVQPTIEIRKGSKFTVMVNKDLVFPSVYQP